MSANRDAMLRLRAKWKADGKCSRCGGERKNVYLRTCSECRNEWLRSRNTRNTKPSEAST